MRGTRKGWSELSEDEREAELVRAEKYWKHHDKHGSSPAALRERAKLYPEGGIPMRPMPKKLRDDLKRIIARGKGGLCFLSPELYKQAMETEKMLRKKRRHALRERVTKCNKLKNNIGC